MTRTQNPPTQSRGADDLLAADHAKRITDGQGGATDTEVRFAALLLSNLPLSTLLELMEPLAREMFVAPIPRWVFQVATVCIGEGVSPDPGILHDVALRHQIDVPPAFRGQVVSRLWSLQDMAPAAPAASYYRDLLLANHCRRATELVGNRISAAAWSGELAEVHAVVSGELSALTALLSVAVGHNV